ALISVYSDVTSDPEYLPTISAPTQTLSSLPSETYDGKTYKVWWIKEASEAAKPGRYYVDPATGEPKFRVDPGIGGIVTRRADKSEATKFNPPQPALFAVIIDGIMSGKLPWVLVMLGAFLAIVVQLAGVSALAFAVGVYLPLSTTLPIFLGGLVRGSVDRVKKSTPEESDSSPAVLMASGLIAGGSIAGILIALSTAFMPTTAYFIPLEPTAQPTLRAPDVASLKPSDQKPYKVWSEAGTDYLVDDQGIPHYRREVSSVLDLRRRFFPTVPEDLLWPSLAAFSVLVLSLLWVGFRGPSTAERPAEVPEADLSREGEISSGQDDLT
ncbi:MAG TPA: OPT/YSL family transporter, partial [Isosphaeraceae bacterium]|nr:OPT/YSL family transporter [Isosphaeraceae bacterium]